MCSPILKSLRLSTVLSEPVPSATTKVTLLGYEEEEEAELSWESKSGYFVIELPRMEKVQHLKHAWVLKLKYLQENSVDY